ncbi:MAG TPA: fumarylacetoacetate hydrolase family protein [Candidatus Dormibacteraeota bacterium]|nr:fumarylacetoacetate hydrolase family protein [Candidatus Dormibacteraeota bacterium]
MRLSTIRTDRGPRLALLDGGLAVDLAGALDATGERIAALDAPAGAGDPANVLALLRAWDDALPALERAGAQVGALVRSGSLQPSDAQLGPCVPRPGKIVCVGLNYADHARETGQPVPKSPVLFSKWASCVVGPTDDVVRPLGCTDLDYEAELGVVIGRTARHVPVESALGVVAGYCCANDVSARGAQLGDGQWVRGKSFDTFCPLGPLVSAGEVPDPQALGIGCRVDGEVRQDSSTAQMVFGVAELIAFCSRSFTLEPGDVILTGTPPGVALGHDPAPWLQPGQLCEVWIDGLGTLGNRIVDESAVRA